MKYDKELDVALQAADLAGRVVMDHYARFKAIPNAPADISTQADKQAQEIILDHLFAHFPNDAYSAEEKTAALANAPPMGPRLWIVDPIDGSRGFARKNDEFSIMIGFVHQGEVVVGVIAEPARERLTFGIRGGGCWKRDGQQPAASRCRVSDVADLARSTLVQSRSRDPGVPTDQVSAIRPAKVLEHYSAGLKMVIVARGEGEMYVNRYAAFHDWDVAAGHVLIEEAGGKVTGLGGQPLVYGTEGAWQRHGLLASNGRIHAAALAALATILQKAAG